MAVVGTQQELSVCIAKHLSSKNSYLYIQTLVYIGSGMCFFRSGRMGGLLDGFGGGGGGGPLLLFNISSSGGGGDGNSQLFSSRSEERRVGKECRSRW